MKFARQGVQYVCWDGQERRIPGAMEVTAVDEEGSPKWQSSQQIPHLGRPTAVTVARLLVEDDAVGVWSCLALASGTEHQGIALADPAPDTTMVGS